MILYKYIFIGANITFTLYNAKKLIVYFQFCKNVKNKLFKYAIFITNILVCCNI